MSAESSGECGRCGFPADSDGECEGCEDPGHTCIACDQEWCAKCWDGAGHAATCPPDERAKIIAPSQAASVKQRAASPRVEVLPDGNVFVTVSREEALELVKSLVSQILSGNPNAGRVEHRLGDHAMFTIAVSDPRPAWDEITDENGPLLLRAFRRLPLHDEVDVSQDPLFMPSASSKLLRLSSRGQVLVEDVFRAVNHLTWEQLDVMEHALGGLVRYRNYFVTSKGSTYDQRWSSLVALGFAEVKGSPSADDIEVVYRVRPSGRLALAMLAPAVIW
jgi:hypothetical protein